MSYYTLVRDGKALGVKALTDAMAIRLEAHGVQVTPAEAPDNTPWSPVHSLKIQSRVGRARPAF